MSFQLIRSDEAHCQFNAERLQIKLLCKTKQLLFSKTSFLDCVGYKVYLGGQSKNCLLQRTSV